MLSEQGLASQNCYKYFPGVYAFWRWVITLFGDSLVSLQWRYLGVLILNGLLVAAILYRTSGRVSWSWYGLFWYLVASERFQGFAGTTGPIATIPLLMALLAWAGRPIVGKSAWIYVLVIGTGKDTKRLNGITHSDKSYTAVLSLGTGTNTLDTEGNVTDQKQVPALTVEKIESVLHSFLGKTMQIPPMFSAKKINGTRLYKLARKNIEIDRNLINYACLLTIPR